MKYFFTMALVIDVIALILTYFLISLPKWIKEEDRKGNFYMIFKKTCLFIYISFVLYFTIIIPITLPIPFINTHFNNFVINIIPYNDLLLGRGYKESLLNLIMCIPLGILVPIIYKNKQNFLSFIKTMILFTIFIELAQLISPRGISSFDITDIINNCIGGIIGYLIFIIIGKRVDKLFAILLSKNSIKGYHVSKKLTKIFIIIFIFQLFVRSFVLNL